MKQPNYLIKVEIPALDRLCDLLEAKDQAAIDQLTQRVTGLRVELRQQTARLQADVDEANAR